jgi:hypothetical protein
MKNALILIAYISIGFGITVSYSENHHKRLPVGTGAFVVVSLMWPALVAADAYRALAPKGGDA